MKDDCWPWKAGLTTAGYGYVRVRGRAVHAHRLVWEKWYGPIPDGLCVLHHCDVRACVNPWHLWLGTKSGNARDRDTKGRQARGDANGARKHPERLARRPEQMKQLKALLKGRGCDI